MQTVAVIGNGPSLRSQRLGARIDACDVIVRMNSFDLSLQWREHVGSRTDIYATYLPPLPQLLTQLSGVREIWWVMIGAVAHVLEPRGKTWEPWCSANQIVFSTVSAEAVARGYAELGITAAERQAADKKPTSGVVVLLQAMISFPDATIYVAGYDGYQHGESTYYFSTPAVGEHEIRKIALDKQRAWFARLVTSGRVKVFDNA